MNLWDKVKNVFSDSVDVISEKTTEWSQLAKLRWEHRNVQNLIEKQLNELGGKAYHLFGEKREKDLTVETAEIVNKLKTMEKELVAKEKEIEALVEKGVDKTHLKEFRKDLELGDGKIEQIVIAENSGAIGKKLLEFKLPKNVLVGAIVRDEKVIIPDGQTKFKSGDKVTLLGEKADVEKAMEVFK